MFTFVKMKRGELNNCTEPFMTTLSKHLVKRLWKDRNQDGDRQTDSLPRN